MIFALSHHSAGELHRCYRILGQPVCARCLGTYPVALLVIVLQASERAALEWQYDAAWVLGLTTPALVDWAFGRFFPHRFSNLWRTFTGVLLGLALGRSLYLHFVRPWPQVLLFQALWVTAVATPVILVSYRRSHGRVDQ